MERVIEIQAEAVAVPGSARGVAEVANAPISFWGGLNPETGEVIDRRHPLSGRVLTGKVLVIPHGRGSCSASGVLLEAIMHGKAPAAIIVSRLDPIIGLGSILGDELYGRTVPVFAVSEADRHLILDRDVVTLETQGRIRIERTRP